MKGGFSMESNETTQSYKDGVSKFRNNVVGAFDPSLNFVSKAATIMSSADVKTKSLSEGNIEKVFSESEINELSKPTWIQKWVRLPQKGF